MLHIRKQLWQISLLQITLQPLMLQVQQMHLQRHFQLNMQPLMLLLFFHLLLELQQEQQLLPVTQQPVTLADLVDAGLLAQGTSDAYGNAEEVDFSLELVNADLLAQGTSEVLGDEKEVHWH
jgi:hypothetical protein